MRFSQLGWWRNYRLMVEPLRGGVRTLLILNVVIFVLRFFVQLKAGAAFDILFGLSEDFYTRGFYWKIVTYMFLHGGFFHLLFNMLILYFMGTETERTIGTPNFLLLYFISGMLSGLGWLLLSGGGRVIGASGAVCGVLGAFAALFPNRRITVLLFFIIPITMRAWVLVLVLAGLEVMFMVSHVMPIIAHSAHLTGLAVGYIYAWIAFRGGRLNIRIHRNVKNPAGLKILHREDADAISPQEVDRILDKIAHEGMSSLTPKERTVLEQASGQRRNR